MPSLPRYVLSLHCIRFSLMTSLLNWLGETPAQKNSQGTPGYLSFGMAVLAVGVVRAFQYLHRGGVLTATDLHAPIPSPNTERKREHGKCFANTVKQESWIQALRIALGKCTSNSSIFSPFAQEELGSCDSTFAVQTYHCVMLPTRV